MSWVVSRRDSGQVVGDFFDRRVVDRFDRSKVLIEEAGDYLSRINAAIAARSWVDRVPLGAAIKACDGFTERFGKVYGRIRTRFGDALRVKFEDYTFDTCFGLNSGPGIGWHLVGKAGGQ